MTQGHHIPASTTRETTIVKALLAAAALSMLSGTALANHQCRLETYDTVGGRTARLVPIGPNAHCGARGRRALTEREARIDAYFSRRSGTRASPNR